jgi:hypothetical protein
MFCEVRTKDVEGLEMGKMSCVDLIAVTAYALV